MSPAPRPALIALYALSGAGGLVLEAAFARQLGWTLGAGPVPWAITLAGFLGGLALGAALLAPIAARTARPLRLYGFLELSAAALGAGLVALGMSGRGPASGPLAFLLLLLPTFPMGGTFPALVRAFGPGRNASLGPVALLYGANTLGASLGVLLAGFALFESLGISRTGYAGAAILAAVGAAALLLDRPATPPASREPTPAAPRPVLLLAAAAGGAASLGAEVVWTRLLTLPMRSSAYAFSLMLAVFLVGIMAGSLLVSALAARIARPERWLAGVLALEGLALAWIPRAASSALASPIEAPSFEAFLARGALRAAGLVLLPTLLSGAALPLAIRALAGKGEAAGSSGRLYAVNTAGSIAGALLAGLALLPALGAFRTLAVLGVLAAAPAARLLPRTVPALVLAAIPLALSPQAFHAAFLAAGPSPDSVKELLYFEEGAADTIAVVRRDYGAFDPDAKSLLTNAVAMSATTAPVRRYMAVEGHLPVLLARQPRRAAVLCLGTGITLGAVASHRSLQRIDAVDLSKGVIGALPLFAAENGRPWDDPRVGIVRADARRFLAAGGDPYDVITLEPPPPIVAGSAHLYSREFYAVCRRRLAPGGVVAQWLPLHAQSLESARSAARTFLEAFPHVQLWLPSIRDAVLVGSDGPLAFEMERLVQAWRDPRVRVTLDGAYLETPEAFLATYQLDRAGIERWAGRGEIITDERPVMEFFRGRGRTMTDAEIAPLLEVPPAPAWPGSEQERRLLRASIAGEIAGRSEGTVDAARRSRGTGFFRSRLGCAPMQLAALGSRADRAAQAQRARCAALSRGGP